MENLSSLIEFVYDVSEAEARVASRLHNGNEDGIAILPGYHLLRQDEERQYQREIKEKMLELGIDDMEYWVAPFPEHSEGWMMLSHPLSTLEIPLYCCGPETGPNMVKVVAVMIPDPVEWVLLK